MLPLPFFRYNPDALSLGIIKKESTHCPVCDQQRDYVYEGPFFSEEEVEGICPWCIHDGSAAKKYNGEFQDAASCEEVDKEEYVIELTTRTPGYNGWQQEQWLSHCGDFCAYKGPVGWKEFEHLKEELEDDIENILSDYDFTQKELKWALEKDRPCRDICFNVYIAGNTGFVWMRIESVYCFLFMVL